jgi:hypothetical protein
MAAAQPGCSTQRRPDTVKFKFIPSLSHNLTHSFMSGMNYFGGDHVYPHVYAMARRSPGRVVTINWIPATTADLFAFPTRVRTSIRSYRSGFVPQLLKAHRVTPEMLSALRTEVYVGKNFRLYVKAVAVDSRGKTYEQFVRT